MKINTVKNETINGKITYWLLIEEKPIQITRKAFNIINVILKHEILHKN